MSLTSFMVRTIFKRGDDKRDAGCTTPQDIRRFDDIVYGLNPSWNRLDVYRPKDAEGLLPVIVSVHGGGWVYGDKERYQYYCMSLAQQGVCGGQFHISTGSGIQVSGSCRGYKPGIHMAADPCGYVRLRYR